MAKRSLLGILKRFDRAGEVLECIKCTSQWWDLTTMYLGLKAPKFPFHFQTRKGQKIELNTFHDLITVWVIFCRHEYPVPEGAQVVIDAGANIGTFSIYASFKQAQEIHALEPFPETYSQLEQNIRANRLENKVHLNAVALADQTGTRKMDLSDGPSQSRGLLGQDQNEGLEVKTLTLQKFIENLNHSEIDLLKIDIEGGEHEVFHSSTPETLKKIKNIAMEYHPNKPKKDLFNKITSSGFQLVQDFPISHASGVATFKRL
jgi:FkbM family methyltransferase